MFMEALQSTSAAPLLPVGESTVFSRLEWQALAIGIMDGRTASMRSRVYGLFVLFGNPRPTSLANPKLEALRAYAELGRALLPRAVPATNLEELGFTALQIEAALELVAAEAASGRAAESSRMEE